MVRALGQRFEAFFRAVTPDPFVLAVFLTLVVFGLAAAVEGTSPLDILRAWQGDAGFWSLLAFTMQMVLILVTGHAVASTRAVSALIRSLASLPQTGAQAAALVALVAIGAALLNWGLGLIVGALLAREVGRAMDARGVPAHYPLIVAAGYAGLMCWHGGLSGSAPLMVTSADNLVGFLGADLAARVGPLGFDQTVLALPNLVVSGGLLVLVPLCCLLLAPAPQDTVGRAAYVDEERPEAETESTAGSRVAWPYLVLPFLAQLARLVGDRFPQVERVLDSSAAIAALGGLVAVGAFRLAQNHRDDRDAETVPERIERHPATVALVVWVLAAAVFRWFADVGVARLDPNAVNLLFLTLGLALHGSLRRYVAAVDEAVRGITGIVLQFPFYAGIMGVMRTTGLAATFAGSMAALAPAQWYTTVTFLSAGLVNLFVPSGGGQWAVQGPIAVQAAERLSIPVEQVVMAVAYGDQWTNMLQPFWALPLLAITGIKARDILGYTTVFLIVGGVWMVGCLYVWASL